MEEKDLIETEETTLDVVDQEDDFTLETMRVRSSLRFRLPFVLGAVALYFLLRLLDGNAIFNPVNAPVFLWMIAGIFLYALVVLNVMVRTRPELFAKKVTWHRFKRLNETLDFLSVIPYLMVGLTVLNMFFLSFSPISGTSMEPNFSDDEAVVFSHLRHDYERFDVVIVYVPELDDPYLIKRVIGLPGETVEIDDNDIYINGERLVQDFIDQDQVSTYCIGEPDANYCRYEIPAGEYFVLGDNRDGRAVAGQISGHSIDSRSFGTVPLEQLFGRVVFTFKDYNILD